MYICFRICILGVMEFCWNTFPSTSESSMALHVCHLMIICGLFLRRNPAKDLNLPIKKSSDQNKTKWITTEKNTDLKNIFVAIEINK